MLKIIQLKSIEVNVYDHVIKNEFVDCNINFTLGLLLYKLLFLMK